MAIHRKHLKDNGVKILSAMENIPETPEGVLLESLLEGMNQYYSEELSQKTLRGLRETRIKGKNYRLKLSAERISSRLFLGPDRNNFSGAAPFAFARPAFPGFVVSVEKTTAFRDFIYRLFEIFWNFFLKVAKRLRV